MSGACVPADQPCLALDFGGTIAARGRSPLGFDVVAVLRDQFGYHAPAGFDAVVDETRAEAQHAYRRSGQQTSWEATLAAAGKRAALALPDPAAVAEALWRTVPDSAVDPAAAGAVQSLHQSGYGLILACNTQRPLQHRRETLADAGLADCFSAFVVSSELGVGKPDPAFYAAVADAGRARTGCGPGDILFVGDSLDRDVIGPLTYGMRAVLVAPGRRPAGLPREVPVVEHLADLPAMLARCA
jgi:FMN phosphatase YigB (HAD superfamily)